MAISDDFCANLKFSRESSMVRVRDVSGIGCIFDKMEAWHGWFVMVLRKLRRSRFRHEVSAAATCFLTFFSSEPTSLASVFSSDGDRQQKGGKLARMFVNALENLDHLARTPAAWPLGFPNSANKHYLLPP